MRFDASPQSIPDNTATAITWLTEQWDTAGMFNPAFPTRLTPTLDGLWWVTASIIWDTSAAGNYRYADVRESVVLDQIWGDNRMPLTGVVTICSPGGFMRIDNHAVTGQYFEVVVKQDSGGPLVVNAGSITFTAFYLGTLT